VCNNAIEEFEHKSRSVQLHKTSLENRKNIIDANILKGKSLGQSVFNPRIDLISSEE
jgi:hypothetical protein